MTWTIKSDLEIIGSTILKLKVKRGNDLPKSTCWYSKTDLGWGGGYEPPIGDFF